MKNSIDETFEVLRKEPFSILYEKLKRISNGPVINPETFALVYRVHDLQRAIEGTKWSLDTFAERVEDELYKNFK